MLHGMPPSGQGVLQEVLGAQRNSSRELGVQLPPLEAEGKVPGEPRSTVGCGYLALLWYGHVPLGARTAHHWPHQDRHFPTV